MNFIFFVFNPLERLRVALSFLWGGKHVFVHFYTACKSGKFCFRKQLEGSFKETLKGELKGGLKGACPAFS